MDIQRKPLRTMTVNQVKTVFLRQLSDKKFGGAGENRKDERIANKGHQYDRDIRNVTSAPR